MREREKIHIVLDSNNNFTDTLITLPEFRAINLITMAVY